MEVAEGLVVDGGGRGGGGGGFGFKGGLLSAGFYVLLLPDEAAAFAEMELLLRQTTIGTVDLCFANKELDLSASGFGWIFNGDRSFDWDMKIYSKITFCGILATGYIKTEADLKFLSKILKP